MVNLAHSLVLLFASPWRSDAFWMGATTSTTTTTAAAAAAAGNRHGYGPSSYLVRHAQRLICEFESTDFRADTDWPYTAQDMKRIDESDDGRFYGTPRFVTHIDDRAIQALTDFYQEEMEALMATPLIKDGSKTKPSLDVLDLCSSWISHLPTTTKDATISFGRVVGVGMNEEELKANQQLTEYFVQDLNKNPTLEQLDDNSFDVICNVVSVDYLVQPRRVFAEIHRLLRPGGVALMSFSNRCFPTKAITMWLQADDIDRLTIVASYFHYTAPWKSLQALDIIPPPLELPERPGWKDMLQDPGKAYAWMNTASAVQKNNSGDPMYVVKAVK
eukprot:scaffold10660_cov176-Amphora_coffeaeformis.AAC.3